MSDVSIYNISHKLLDLMARYADLQEELIVSPEQADATGKAIEDLDKEITAFLGSELVKDRIDGVSGFLLMAKGRAKEARAEAARLTRAADSWEHREKRLKGYLQNVMENAGLKRLEGRTSIMRLQANGGSDPPPLISQPDLVPDELCEWTGSLSHQTMTGLLAAIQTWAENTQIERTLTTRLFALRRTPSNSLIREALMQPCGECGGTGELVNDGPHSACGDCGGSGRAAVPGCSLQERGSHLRVA